MTGMAEVLASRWLALARLARTEADAWRERGQLGVAGTLENVARAAVDRVAVLATTPAQTNERNVTPLRRSGTEGEAR